MRVFYPISARISDVFNNDKVVQSGWTTVWSMLSVVVLAVVFSSLSSFEGGAAEQQHALFTKNHYDHNGHLIHTQASNTDTKIHG